MKQEFPSPDKLAEAFQIPLSPRKSLNEAIKIKIKEAKDMQKDSTQNIRKPLRIVIASIALLLCVSIGAFALNQLVLPVFITGNEEVRGIPGLENAFREGDGILINETAEVDDYKITLIGIAKGKNLLGYDFYNDDAVVLEKSYVVLSVAHKTEPLREYRGEGYSGRGLSVTPLIVGYDPCFVRDPGAITGEEVFDMREGAILNGVRYVVLEASSFDQFTESGVYLAVQYAGTFESRRGSWWQNDIFDTNADRSEFTFKEDVPGQKVIFKLPVTQKGDPEALQQMSDRFYGNLYREWYEFSFSEDQYKEYTPEMRERFEFLLSKVPESVKREMKESGASGDQEVE